MIEIRNATLTLLLVLVSKDTSTPKGSPTYSLSRTESESPTQGVLSFKLSCRFHIDFYFINLLLPRSPSRKFLFHIVNGLRSEPFLLP